MVVQVNAASVIKDHIVISELHSVHHVLLVLMPLLQDQVYVHHAQQENIILNLAVL